MLNFVTGLLRLQKLDTLSQGWHWIRSHTFLLVSLHETASFFHKPLLQLQRKAAPVWGLIWRKEMGVRGPWGEAASPSCILRAEHVVWTVSLFHLSCLYSMYCSVHKQSPPAAGMHSPESHLSASSWRTQWIKVLASCLCRGKVPGRLASGCSQNGVCSAASDPVVGAGCPWSRVQTRYSCLGFPRHPGNYKCKVGCSKLFKGCSCNSGKVSSPAHIRYLKIIFSMLILHFEKGLSQLPISFRSRDQRLACQFWRKTRKTAVNNRVYLLVPL